MGLGVHGWSAAIKSYGEPVLFVAKKQCKTTSMMLQWEMRVTAALLTAVRNNLKNIIAALNAKHYG